MFSGNPRNLLEHFFLGAKSFVLYLSSVIVQDFTLDWDLAGKKRRIPTVCDSETEPISLQSQVMARDKQREHFFCGMT